MLARVSSSSKRIVTFSFAVLLAAGVAFCLYAWHAARAAMADGAKVAASSGRAGVSVFTLRPSSSRFEPVLIAPEFQSAVQFGGDLYICGSSALFRYSESELKKSWYAGRELPASRLLSLAVRTGIGNPELWIATDGAGVLIYDGYTFHEFLPDNPALRKISAMLPLSNGGVLLGTAAGLYYTDGKSFRVFHPQFANTQVTALAGGEDQFWIGTRADGAWLWRGGDAVHIIADLPDAQVLSLASKGDQAWIGTALGVVEFRDRQLSRRLADGLFAQALAQHDGKLWIGTIDQGTFAIPLGAQKTRPQLSSVAGETESAASFVQIGDTLAAVQPRQVIALPGRQSLIAAPKNSLASGHITAVHQDSHGRLWVGYFDHGIDVLPPSNDAIPAHFEDDTLFCINRIKENPQDGSLLAATANGLAVFDAGGRLRQVLTTENGLIANSVTDVLFEANEAASPSLVIATPAGLSFLEHGSMSSIYAFHGLVNNHVYTLAALNGNLYAGTLGGVSSLRHGLVQASFNTANSQLRQNWITASAVFGHHLYLGTYGSGVIRFDDGAAIQSSPLLNDRRIEISLNALLATDRALYAGTAGQGLAILRAGDERWQFISEGLPSLNVTALDERDGRLYIGTGNGLVRISENNLLP